ncbi:hypothetical protein CRP01_09250 [Flavilitoribacter nigricans DSM 23189 = NBRC 102662]|uniref:Uncharacterized protein n=1 Tax=Flavilitoribacter nigricans (strain ATCC 23147 / DSM 23189 / NBRC 102662 / NCIMB 1420 / SS-2) TaxID=1122177 RepID=A0A2D0NEW5_FLAN2|nr:hypothetical protein CRP01_09250 [Flavilitoribacter nigricans DSM 23189 = NBRC 102662]
MAFFDIGAKYCVMQVVRHMHLILLGTNTADALSFKLEEWKCDQSVQNSIRCFLVEALQM